MTLRVLIADDELQARKRLTRLLGVIPGVTVVGDCPSGEALLETLRTEAVDVLLLDIHMPGLSGLETSRLLPEDGPYVIFITAHPEHALDAFDVGAVDYVVKPVEAGRLKKAIDRAAAHIRPTSSADTPVDNGKIAIETAKGIVFIAPDEISHAEYDGFLVTLHVGDRFIATDLSLTELETRLAPSRFERVHRRHLLNLDHVERLEPLPSGGYTAHTKSGDEVPVSRQAARQLRKRLGI